jgi:hypothetical protein
MERERTPEPADSGLSTDDLAAPRLREKGEESEGLAHAPAFPGEATEATPQPAASPPREEATLAEDELPQLLAEEDEESFRTHWQEIQNRFVDDPREAVHAADALVADVMQTLAATFAQHKRDLEAQWSQGGEANTEDLRVALRNYRSFFNRLLSS